MIYGVKTKIVVCDFKDSLNEGFFENIKEQVKNLDISILVNNVGICLPFLFTKNKF